MLMNTHTGAVIEMEEQRLGIKRERERQRENKSKKEGRKRKKKHRKVRGKNKHVKVEREKKKKTNSDLVPFLRVVDHERETFLQNYTPTQYNQEKKNKRVHSSMPQIVYKT